MRILRGLTSRLLTCGCLAGIYETYEGTVVTLLDARDPGCQIAGHVAGHEVPEFSITTPGFDSNVTIPTDDQHRS